jgi:ADP-ribose pyrophosphatase
METVAYNFHDESGIFNNINLIAGDDAKHVRWTDISSNLNLYANHRDFILKVVEMRNGHW